MGSSSDPLRPLFAMYSLCALISRNTMQGYFVVTKEPETEAEQELLTKLNTTALVNLKHTRTFNQVTGGVYKQPVKSAVTRLRNNTEEQKKKRKEYYTKEETKQRLYDYNRSQATKDRKKAARLRKAKLLSLVPPDLIAKVYAEEQRGKL